MKDFLKISTLLVTITLSSCNTEEKKFNSLVRDNSVSAIIYDVNIVDVHNGNISPNKTVFISGKKITAITQTFPIDSYRIEKVINGNGMYLSPGLWDMHTHSQGKRALKQIQLPLYIIHGITGIREMSGLPYELAIRDSIDAGLINGPRMVIGSPVLDRFPNSSGTPFILVPNTKTVKPVIDSIENENYDFIKTYDFLEADVYTKIHEIASEKGIPVTGHIPIDVSIWDAARLGHKSIEHNIGIELGASTSEDELRDSYRSQISNLIETETNQEEMMSSLKTIKFNSFVQPLSSLDESKLDSLYRFLNTNEAWIVPTLFLQRAITNPNILKDDPGLSYFPKKYRSPFIYKMEYDPKSELDEIHNYRLNNFNKYIDSDFNIMAGSDAFGGFPLQRELELYVELGLSSHEALQTATINPAKFMGKEDSLGTIEVGKLADLILLEDNPIEDIKNIRKIYTVIMNGKVYSKSDLDQMKQKMRYIADNIK